MGEMADDAYEEICMWWQYGKRCEIHDRLYRSDLGT